MVITNPFLFADAESCGSITGLLVAPSLLQPHSGVWYILYKEEAESYLMQRLSALN